MRELNTERLYLRHIREEDTQRIFDCWASKPEVTRYLTWYPHESVEQTTRFVAGWLDDYRKPDCMRWGIQLRETGDLIGMIDVVAYDAGKPVIGYCSGPDYWGNGYMTEALRAVTQELFVQGFEEILIEAVAENIGSNRVIEKAGFTRTQTRREKLSRLKPEIVTIHSYRLKRS